MVEMSKLEEIFFSFLRAIALEPIEWTQAVAMTGKAAPYVGEILDAAFANAQAVVVVMTSEDEARLRQEYVTEDDPTYERELTPQPRPNVLFEAGLALGRQPDRTLLVEIGQIRPFSDMAGRHTVRLDNSIEMRQALAQRLQTAGCSIDISGTDWHTDGDFEIRVTGDTVETTTEPSNSPVAQANTDELSSTEVDILKLMSDVGNQGPTIDDVSIQLGIHPTRAAYFIEQMALKDYLDAHLTLGQPLRFALVSKGRAYLVKHNLV